LGKRIRKIAFPQIGTGYGKLEWDKVKELIEKTFQDLDNDIVIEIYLNYNRTSSNHKERDKEIKSLDYKKDKRKTKKSTKLMRKSKTRSKQQKLPQIE